MKNPWKKLSSVNPQREDGTRQINTDVLRKIIRLKLSASEIKILLCVIEKTWGYNKKSDTISNSQFVQATNLSKRAVILATNSLRDMRLICFEPSTKRVQRGSPLNEYLFNKHYDTWIEKGANSCKGANLCKKRVNKRAPTIETSTKEIPPPIVPPLKSSKQAFNIKTFDYPDWLNTDLWFEFVRTRTKIKKPIASTVAVNRLLNKLKKLIDEGHDQEEVIGLSIEKCWQGFFAPKTESNHTNGRKYQEL